jgi:hypothetical protein
MGDDFTQPALFVGQVPCLMAKEISTVEKTVDLFDSSQSLKVACDLGGRLSGLEKRKDVVCCPLNQTPCTWLEGYRSNSEYSTEGLVDVVRSSLELCRNPHRLTVFQSANGTLHPTILESLSAELSELSFLSVSLIPSGGISGLSCLHFVLNASYFVHFSEGCVLRGTDDLQYLQSQSKSQDRRPSVSQQEMLRLLATDLCFAMNHSQWLLSNQLNRGGFCDVRTSLWRTVLPRAASAVIPEFNSLRACSQNLRAAYLNLNNGIDIFRDGETCIRNASILNLRMGKTGYAECPVDSAESEISTALKWATPDLSWPSTTGHSERNLWSKSEKVKFSASEVTKSSSNVFVLGFESPFAKSIVRSVLKKAEGLISKRAYLHLFTDGSFGTDDLVAAVETLKDFV